MKSIITNIILLFISASLLISCDDGDNFSSDPNLKLDFPTDIITFDTVFMSVISPMQGFYVSNKNKHSISFESIELMNAEESGFRINVNGQAGTVFRDEDLLKKDSILILVDINAIQSTGTGVTEDKIKFSWNGNTSYVTLRANPIEVEIWDDKEISEYTQLTSDKGYYIKGKITVNEGTTLSIEKGTTLYFDKNASLTINGTLIANGTTDAPITFRGHRFDFVEPGILYDNTADQWQGVTIGKNSFDNQLQNVRIRNAKYGLNFLESSPSNKKATLTNTVIHNMSEAGLNAINCDIEAINCQITNSRGTLLNLNGGKYSFLHCTISNFYEWHPRLIASVILSDSKDANTVPLNVQFTNSIIVGTFKDELSDYYNRDISSATFTNCVIQSSKERNDQEFINTLWNIDKVFLFKTLNNKNNFVYSFELPKESAAIDKADLTHASLAPNDLRGVSRLTDGKPDIGCYEYTK